jgi:tRNA pseudouridine38/39 synthase
MSFNHKKDDGSFSPILLEIRDGQIDSLDVLNYLLQHQQVTEPAIRAAYQQLLAEQKKKENQKIQQQDVTESKGYHPTVNHNSQNNESSSSAVATSNQTKCNALAADVTQTHSTNPDAATADTSMKITTDIRTRHIALQIYYEGSSYTGLAETVGSDTDRSIEKALFAALRTAHLIPSDDQPEELSTEAASVRTRVQYSRCGRTDRGVSAVKQTVALYLKSAFPPFAVPVGLPNDNNNDTTDTIESQTLDNSQLPKNSHQKIKVWVPPKKKKQSIKNDNRGLQQKEISEYAYDKIINNLLPPDIRVLGWSPVTDDFSARFSCTMRSYRYFFVPRRHWNLSSMRSALQSLVGTHDFRNFCKMDVEKVYNFERKIHSADIVEMIYPQHSSSSSSSSSTNTVPTTWYIQIVGQAFLWHQIRCIASILFLIGRGLEDPSIIAELLDVEKNPRKPAYPLAEEYPLVLHDCQFNNLQIGYSVTNLWNIVCHLEQQWEERILAAARIRNCLDSLYDTATVLAMDLHAFGLEKEKQRQKKQPQRRSIVDSNKSNSTRILCFPSPDLLNWRQAMVWLEQNGLIPDKTYDVAHIPLFQRSKGTSYEEKVASLQNPKRLKKYEDNVIKKRKTKEEDQAFYAHKLRQGGSAL